MLPKILFLQNMGNRSLIRVNCHLDEGLMPLHRQTLSTSGHFLMRGTYLRWIQHIAVAPTQKTNPLTYMSWNASVATMEPRNGTSAITDQSGTPTFCLQYSQETARPGPRNIFCSHRTAIL